MDSKEDIFATSEGKWSFTIALIVIAIFSIFIYQFLFNKAEEEVEVVQLPAKSENTQATSPIINTGEERQYLYTDSNIYQATTIQAEDAYETDIKTAVVISDIEKPKAITTDGVSNPKSNRNTTKPASETRDSVASNELKTNKQPSSIQLEEKTIATTTPAKPSTTAKMESTPTNTNFNCVAIVGVFKQVKNKIAIIEKLKSLGHTTSEGVLREGMFYVGVPIACDNEQGRQKLLSELNQAFGIASWIKKI